MPHLSNWQEFGLTTGQDKQTEPVNEYDRVYGAWKCNVQYKTKPEAQVVLPNTPEPFANIRSK